MTEEDDVEVGQMIRTAARLQVLVEVHQHLVAFRPVEVMRMECFLSRDAVLDWLEAEIERAVPDGDNHGMLRELKARR